MARHSLASLFFAFCALFNVFTIAESLGVQGPIERRSIHDGVHLKIMPLGASITTGWGSEDGNGYRLVLKEKLEAHGNKVSYVGTQRSGRMPNNSEEGWPGITIPHLADKIVDNGALEFRPNVILVNVGTNDCNMWYQDPEHGPQNYGILLDNIKTHNPDALVVVSSLLHHLNETTDACIVRMNKRVKKVALKAKADGQKIEYVDMYDAVPKSMIKESDKTHPNDAGFAIMAEVWYKGLKQAGDKITSPSKKGKAVPKDRATSTSSASASPTPSSPAGRVQAPRVFRQMVKVISQIPLAR